MVKTEEFTLFSEVIRPNLFVNVNDRQLCNFVSRWQHGTTSKEFDSYEQAVRVFFRIMIAMGYFFYVLWRFFLGNLVLSRL